VRRTSSDSDIVKLESLADLLLPISKLMLEGGVGFDQLLRAGKYAYVRAAISEIIPTGSRLNISLISVATGLTRKDVSAVVRHLAGRRPQSVTRTKEQRALRVLRGWISDPRFHGPNGRPADLQSRGDGATFQMLVRQYAGDVTPAAVLRELERMRAVRVTAAKTLRLRSERKKSPHGWAERVTELTRLFGDFAATVSGPRVDGDRPEFFGFREFEGLSPDEVARFQRTFARRGAALLESFEHWNAGREGRRRTPEGSRVALGVYLVRDVSSSKVPRG
jgi:Family of unknown function (DUF6502)